MTGELRYARYGPTETRIHRCAAASSADRILIFDLAGEIRTPSLRDRLLSLGETRGATHVLLRGASDELRAEIVDHQGTIELMEQFPGAAVWLVESVESVDLVALNDGALAASALGIDLLKWCAQAELEASLVWNNAIWSERSYHFILPSGHHSDKFIRVGEVFADPLTVARLADWYAAICAPPAVIIADTFTLLPLLQELELRWLRRSHLALLQDGGQGVAVPNPLAQRVMLPLTAGGWPKCILPLYGVSPDVLRERLAEVVPLARESGAPIVAIVSVSASGGYVAALRSVLNTFFEPPQLRVLALCATGDQPELDALCHLPASIYADRASCKLCADGASKPMEIDEQRLTTRLGVTVLPMPATSVIEDASIVIRDADQCEAFRVHVDRVDRHGHLAIYIDTASLLQSRVFRAKATLGLEKALSGFVPDLVLTPTHDATLAIHNWIERQQRLPSPVGLATNEALTPDVADQIHRARTILFVDDAIITGRTLLALVELVQKVKSDAQDSDFQFRGFVLVARPARSSVWTGLRDRFFVRNRHGLFAGWEVNLPDVGVNERAACPWCVELRLLENVIPSIPEAAREYLTRRIERLKDPNGLSKAIFLGAEAAPDVGSESGWNPAIHTSPNSYLGNVSDVGAFVAASALLQRMRDEWNRSPERWSTRHAMPLVQLLIRYTDPVIIGAFLRGITEMEVWSGQTEEDLIGRLQALDHEVQHGVLAAEVLLATQQRKLPQGADISAFEQSLTKLPPDIRLGLDAVFRRERVLSRGEQTP